MGKMRRGFLAPPASNRPPLAPKRVAQELTSDSMPMQRPTAATAAAVGNTITAKDKELAAMRCMLAEQMELLTQAMEMINGLEMEWAAERMEEAKKLAAAREEAQRAAVAEQRLRAAPWRAAPAPASGVFSA